MEPKKRRLPRLRSWKAVLVVVITLLVVGMISLVVLMDQTAFVGMAYLRAVNANNTWAAELLGDQFSEDRNWRQTIYKLDIQRDEEYLANAELSDVTTSREQTLSGQWVTVVRFKWKGPESLYKWQPAALRVKTDRWLIFTYIRTVEIAEP